MADEDDNESTSVRPTVRAVGTVLEGAAGAIGGPMASAAMALLFGKIEEHVAAGAQRRRKQAELELEQLLATNPQMAALLVPGDPEQEDMFFRIYRNMMDAYDLQAIRPLVLLTGDYLGRRPDAFFFGAGTLFKELVGSQFGILRQVLDACVTAPEPSRRAHVLVRPTEGHKEEIMVFGPGSSGAVLSDADHVHELISEDNASGVPVVVALKRSGLATESPGGGAGQASGPGRMLFELEVARRLRALL